MSLALMRRATWGSSSKTLPRLYSSKTKSENYPSALKGSEISLTEIAKAV